MPDDGQPLRQKRIPSQKKALARQFRQKMTPAESVLWDQLHTGRLCHAKFRRQHVIAGFIADFYCHSARLVVEIDGEVHANQATEDAKREEALAALGLSVIRFTNDAVMNDLPGVLRSIAAALASQRVMLEPSSFRADSLNQTNSPLPLGEG